MLNFKVNATLCCTYLKYLIIKASILGGTFLEEGGYIVCLNQVIT